MRATLFENKRKWYKRLICFLFRHAYLPDKQSFVDLNDKKERIGVGRYTICHRCGLYQLTEYHHEQK